LAMAALTTMRTKYPLVYTKYGFADAFNPNTGWVNQDVIGIDLGITLLSAENAATANVWRWFMRNNDVRRALDLAGLKKQQHRARIPLRKAA